MRVFALSKRTDAVRLAKLTVAVSTPGLRLSLFSTVLAQPAHVIPPIGNSTSWVFMLSIRLYTFYDASRGPLVSGSLHERLDYDSERDRIGGYPGGACMAIASHASVAVSAQG